MIYSKCLKRLICQNWNNFYRKPGSSSEIAPFLIRKVMAILPKSHPLSIKHINAHEGKIDSFW